MKRLTVGPRLRRVLIGLAVAVACFLAGASAWWTMDYFKTRKAELKAQKEHDEKDHTEYHAIRELVIKHLLPLEQARQKLLEQQGK